MATLPAAAYLSDASRTEAQYKQAHEDHLAGTKQIPGAGVVELTVTIASGSITPAGSGGVVVVDTEAAAATDDLTNIVTTNYPDGSMLLLRNSNSARFVVAKHLSGGAGQMNLDRSGEYTLDDTKKWLLLQRRSADWYEVFRGPQKPLSEMNPIINGAMEIWQRGTAFAAITSGGYAADRWKREGTSAAVFTVNRSTSVPTVAQAGVLFNYSLEVDVTTADGAVAAGDLETVVQAIEGFNWRHFAQRQVTVSFWAYSTKTGTHCVALRNSGDDRSYVGTYSISVTNTWEYKTVVMVASPSAGTWDYTTGVGAKLVFTLMCGSTFQTTAGAWQTGNFSGTSAQVNVMDSTSNFFRLTGVKLELGPIATPLILVPFVDEHLRCQRYYQKSFIYGTAPAQSAGTTGSQAWMCPTAATVVAGTRVEFPTMMRAAPTITTYNPNAANTQMWNSGAAADFTGTTVHNPNERGFLIYGTAPGGTVAGHIIEIHWQAVAEL